MFNLARNRWSTSARKEAIWDRRRRSQASHKRLWSTLKGCIQRTNLSLWHHYFWRTQRATEGKNWSESWSLGIHKALKWGVSLFLYIFLSSSLASLKVKIKYGLTFKAKVDKLNKVARNFIFFNGRIVWLSLHSLPLCQ